MLRRRGSLKHSLRTIERAFAAIEKHIADALKNVRRAGHDNRRLPKAKKPRRKVRITAKRRAQLKLQGQYMGFMRQLKPAQKAKVRAVKEKRGYEAAIMVARRLRAGK